MIITHCTLFLQGDSLKILTWHIHVYLSFDSGIIQILTFGLFNKQKVKIEVSSVNHNETLHSWYKKIQISGNTVFKTKYHYDIYWTVNTSYLNINENFSVQ